MILEGIVTTINQDGTANVSPMGPIIRDPSFKEFRLRPFQSSTTYRNLKRMGAGVLHVTDDVELFVEGAIGQKDADRRTVPAETIEGFVLEDCCRYFEFKIQELNDQQERTEIDCVTTRSREIRPFWGFNRAKHAVLEAAILATRLHILKAEHVENEMQRLQVIVEKTAGPAEARAFHRVATFISGSGKSNRV